MWGVITPQEAKAKIEQQRAEAGITEPKNLEEQAISLVGTDIYEKLVKGYTGKQWGRPCTELPAFIIKRLPVRFTYDNNYFNALYQGIPNGGYTQMVANMLGDVEVKLGVDYLKNKAELDKLAKKVIYTGPVDAYFDYKLGALQYRSVRFETEILDTDNYQGNAVVNYTDSETAQALRDTRTWSLVNKWQHPSPILQKKDTNLTAGLCQMVTRWTSTPTPSTPTSPSTPVGKQNHTTSPPTSPMKKSVEIFLTFQAETLPTTTAGT